MERLSWENEAAVRRRRPKGPFNPDGSKVGSKPGDPFPQQLQAQLKLLEMMKNGSSSGPTRSFAVARMYKFCPPEGRCLICSLEEHTSSECPYRAEVPKNAIVGRGADIFCKVCGGLFSGRCCNQDSAQAKLKFCDDCRNFGEHWRVECWRDSIDPRLQQN